MARVAVTLTCTAEQRAELVASVTSTMPLPRPLESREMDLQSQSLTLPRRERKAPGQLRAAGPVLSFVRGRLPWRPACWRLCGTYL
jgi:hypothetical protein